MSRSLLRSALELRNPITRLPPTFLLPLHARWLSTTPQFIEPATAPPSRPYRQTLQPLRPSQQTLATQYSKPPTTTTTTIEAETAALDAEDFESPLHDQPTATTAPAPLHTGPISPTVLQLLPLLAAQPAHYITVHIHGRPYLVTAGDSIRLPFRMPGVVPGDVLRLNRASALGSRDFTLRTAGGAESERRGSGASPGYVDERIYECRATVTGVESEPMRLKTKTKRRNRKVKTVRSKHKFTVLRISELKINRADEIETGV